MQYAKRRTNYVDNHVQGALLRRVSLHWLIFFSISAITLIAMQTLMNDSPIGLLERVAIEAGKFSLVAVVMLCLFPAFMLDTIRFSNRFVGPIARIRRHLRELGQGETTGCDFRKGDFWADLANEFNAVTALVESQKQEIASLKQTLETQSESTA